MNAKKLGFERNIHKLVYKHGSASPGDDGHLQASVSPREKCTIALHLNWITQIRHLNWPVDTWWQVNLDPDDGKSRLASQTARKREISRDFSRFFGPAFFRSFIDPICPFRCCVRTRTHEKGFFASSRKQSTLWLDSDLRKRSRTVWKSRRFTNCLQTRLIPPQIVRIWTREIRQPAIRWIFSLSTDKDKQDPPYCLDSNPRKRKICLLSVCFLDFPLLVWYEFFTSRILYSIDKARLFASPALSREQCTLTVHLDWLAKIRCLCWFAN